MQSFISQNFILFLIKRKIFCWELKNAFKNSLLLDYFLTKRIETFIKKWLYQSLEAKCHSCRSEFTVF